FHDQMQPARFWIVVPLPLTPNGKVDRKRLQTLSELIDTGRQAESEYVGPRTPAEEILVGIFKEVLRLDRVGIHDNFFELGGDSILSIQIISKANEAGLDLTPKQLFRHQSIAELAGVASVAGGSRMAVSEQGDVVGTVPLTPIQEWFFEGHNQEPHHYNQAVMLEATEPVDVEALREALKQLMKQHDALRHRFKRTESGWIQICEKPDGAVALEEMDLSGLDENLESRTIEKAAAQYQQGIDLSEGPLLKVMVFGAKRRRPRVLIIAHHLVIDAVSWRI